MGYHNKSLYCFILQYIEYIVFLYHIIDNTPLLLLSLMSTMVHKLILYINKLAAFLYLTSAQLFTIYNTTLYTSRFGAKCLLVCFLLFLTQNKYFRLRSFNMLIITFICTSVHSYIEDELLFKVYF